MKIKYTNKLSQEIYSLNSSISLIPKVKIPSIEPFRIKRLLLKQNLSPIVMIHLDIIIILKRENFDP